MIDPRINTANLDAAVEKDDIGRPIMPAPEVVALSDLVGAMPAPFDDSRVGSMSSAGIEALSNLSDGFGQCDRQVLRGKRPPGQ